MGSTGANKTIRNVMMVGTGAVLCYCAYTVYKSWRKKQIRSIDEGFEDVSKIEDNPDKRILVLGLPNSGKSTILAQVNGGNASTIRSLKPTEGFSVTTFEHNGICLNIWEIGGRVKSYWENFLQDTDILVFVVDSSDVHNLSMAVPEVKRLLANDRLDNVPVLLLANKQDLPNAISPQQVANVLDLHSIPPTKHKVRVLGTQTPPSSTERHPSICEVETLLLAMLND